MAFKDIKGQEKPVERLKAFLRQERLAGAYLFTGPQGVGKTLAAFTFAKALNCLNDDADACDACASCVKINSSQHPDVHLIDASLPAGAAGEQKARKQEAGAEIKIEYIRQLESQISLRPYEGRQKVFIIQDAHNLNQESANAFLKTLEEPPAHSVIILISAKPELLFKTVLSRCRTVKFFSLNRGALAAVLKDEYHCDETLTHFLSYFCEGRLGLALQLKQRDILREKNKAIDDFIFSTNNVFENTRAHHRDTLKMHLNIAATWFRDIYVIKAGLPAQEIINLDRKDELMKFSSRYSLADLDRVFDCICDSLSYVNQNINVKLLLSNFRSSMKA